MTGPIVNCGVKGFGELVDPAASSCETPAARPDTWALRMAAEPSE